MRWILDRLDTWQARIASGFAMLVAAAAALRPDENWTANWPAIGAFAVAALGWLVTNLKGAGTSHPHDTRLFAQIQNLITHDERNFLNTQDFGTLFRKDAWQGVRTVYSSWEGPRFIFTDRALQKSWNSVRAQIDVFSELVVSTTSPARNTDFQTVRTARDEGGLSPETRREAQSMNEAAAELVRRLDTFEQKARRALRV